MRILYIGDKVSQVRSGADTVNLRNINLLHELPGVELDFMPLAPHLFVWDKGLLWSGRVNASIQKSILRRLAKESYDYVVFSSSLMGRVARRVKEEFPQVKIVCCYHNIEKQYAREFLGVSGWSHIPFYLGAVYNERLMARSADVNWVLNDRDAKLLQREYGRSADLVLPVAYEDMFDEEKCRNIYRSTGHSSPRYLFVGSSFFANVDGVRWFIQNVLPHVSGTLVVVGRGMECYAREFASNRVEVMGYVEDLSALYYAATAAVFPIFSGGGMKTKTAEALMYGKTIVGTPEAFEGYRVAPDSMYCCHTAQDFIDTLHRLSSGRATTCPFNPISREVFVENYSFEAVADQFKRIFTQE